MDPHFQNITSNANVLEHMFEPLVSRDADGKLVPALAESWRTVDALNWEFTIRKGAKFSDGSDVTAEDVIHSLDRPATIRNSPASFTLFTKAIVGKKAVDARTVRLTTGQPRLCCFRTSRRCSSSARRPPRALPATISPAAAAWWAAVRTGS
jgi:peptide/nickel transport system substrate-binding protein